MGEFATAVQTRLRDSLADRYPAADWETEYGIGGTPVDVAGEHEGRLYLIELEWRRADPADNAAKIFRHLDAGALNAEAVTLFHVFTEYYRLSRGGVSSKRENAEFVGDLAAETFEHLAYQPVEFGLDPPKRGGDWPERWEELVAETVDTIAAEIEPIGSG